MAHLFLGGFALDVTVSGEFAYVATDGDGLRVVNVSEPAAPSEAGFFDTGDNLIGIAVVGDYAYLANSSDGLRVIDVSEPAALFRAGDFDTRDATDIAVNGDYAYVLDLLDGMLIVDISNPAAPFEVNRLSWVEQAVNVTVDGDIA